MRANQAIAVCLCDCSPDEDGVRIHFSLHCESLHCYIVKIMQGPAVDSVLHMDHLILKGGRGYLERMNIVIVRKSGKSRILKYSISSHNVLSDLQLLNTGITNCIESDAPWSEDCKKVSKAVNILVIASHKVGAIYSVLTLPYQVERQ